MTDEPQPSGDVGPDSLLPIDIAAETYQVLARKYRPTTFEDLIGQEAVVRTLTNAIGSGRLAQAYMLTGVRGTGKTTTARLIARALNCIELDGSGGPTATPCGQCEHCTAIGEDRHVDVLEMDAASRTGVDDIRELLDGVRYRPTSARTKIYIIDEVHMLSTQAFNALLKTLEEPPEHVKFIFATTEIRKVPVTVLSRCQRFNLRRIDMEQLSQLFRDVANKEGAEISEPALALIARAADGSARDGLSILDQAISQSTSGEGSPHIEESHVRDMLGLADRIQVFDLLDAVLHGNVQESLSLLTSQYTSGADPIIVLQDLLELTHWLTRIKVAPEGAQDALAAEAERTRGKAMADALSMPVLTRTWQMLLKGLSEARTAPMPLQAVEMTLVRLAYAADLPTPEEALKAAHKGDGVTPSPRPTKQAAPTAGGNGAQAVAAAHTDSVPQSRVEPHPTPEASINPTPVPQSLSDVVALCDTHNEALLAGQLTHGVHLVHFERGRIEIRPKESTPKDVSGKLSAFLSTTTGERWVVSISNADGEPTLHEQIVEAAAAEPFIKSILDSFPGAIVERVRPASDDS